MQAVLGHVRRDRLHFHNLVTKRIGVWSTRKRLVAPTAPRRETIPCPIHSVGGEQRALPPFVSRLAAASTARRLFPTSRVSIRGGISGGWPIRIRRVLTQPRLQFLHLGAERDVRGKKCGDLRLEAFDSPIPLVLHTYQKSHLDLRVDPWPSSFAQVIDLIQFLDLHPQPSPMAAP
jgi:hypothetical protein